MRFKIPAKQPTSFKASALYLAGQSKDQSPDRVAWMQAHNLETEDPRAAAAVMEATAARNVRCKQQAYHFVLAFDPKDAKGGKLPPEVMQQIASEAIDRLGLAEYQTLIYAHKDTDHPHMHFLVNRIHPKTGKAYDRHADGLRLTELCKDIARERGLNLIQDRTRIAEREHVDDFDDIGREDLRPTSPTDGEYWQAKAEQRTAQIAFTKEQAKALRKSIEPHFHNAGSWEDLAFRLGAKNIALERKGQGLVIVQGEHYAKLSQMGKKVRLDDLERRFGQSFDDHMATMASKLDKAFREETHIEGYEDMTPDQRRRAERLRDAQLAVEKKQQGDRVQQLVEADLVYRYWQGVETSYKFQERRISRLEKDDNGLGRNLDTGLRRQFAAFDEMNAFANQTYRKPERALERLAKLEAEHGINKARELVAENPNLLGGLQGAYMLGFETTARKQAKHAFKRMLTKRRHWQNQKDNVQQLADKRQAVRAELTRALADFDKLRAPIGSADRLRQIMTAKIKARAAALEKCTAKMIEEADLADSRKNQLLKAREAYIKKQKELERSRER